MCQSLNHELGGTSIHNSGFDPIYFSLKGQLGGQKESFKAILGPILRLFCCYYSRLPWPDPMGVLIEKETFSIWNNISRFQNFNALATRTKSLVVSVKKMRQAHDKDKEKYGKKYPDFFMLSSQYINSLESSITNLKVILGRLNDKTKDVNSYLWGNYSSDIENYNKSVESYHRFGNKMNAEFKKIQHSQ